MLHLKMLLVAFLITLAAAKPINPPCTTMAPTLSTQSGIVTSCTGWHSAVLGIDTCDRVAQQYNIPVDSFMSWNPAVGSDCRTMYADYAFCVSTCGVVPAAPIMAPTVTTGPAGPTVLTATSASQSAIASDGSTSSVGSPSYDTTTETQATNSASSYAPDATAAPPSTTKRYHGDGSVDDEWPSMADWISFEALWERNLANMKISCDQFEVANNDAEELQNLKDSIDSVAKDTELDERFILAIITEESHGCVRVPWTQWDHKNPGLMQSYIGEGSCNQNYAEVSPPDRSLVTKPCPAEMIHQMISDGADRTAAGPGLKDCFANQTAEAKNGENEDAQGYYRTARIYNGGHLEDGGVNLDMPCCTPEYASEIANILIGWVKP